MLGPASDAILSGFPKCVITALNPSGNGNTIV